MDRLRPDQVAVRLKNAAGEVDAGVVVWVDSPEPDRIQRIRVARIQVQ